MKKIATIALLLAGIVTFSQKKIDPTTLNYASADASPLDVVYYPLGAVFAKSAEDGPKIKVTYSRPQKKNRTVFGNLVKNGEIWRFGANENTEIKFYTPVKINNTTIEAGTYSMHAIPGEKEWTIIINSDIDKWGSYNYDKTKDIVRFTVPTTKPKTPIEYFSISFVQTKTGTDFYSAWDNTQIKFPIEFVK